MALELRGKYRYGDSKNDISAEIARYSHKVEYLATHFANAICQCGSDRFRLQVDEESGVAVRTCTQCSEVHPIGDSGDYLDEAVLEECACVCGCESFEITVGVSLYDGSEDVRWLYVGCRCVTCGLTAVYGDWKNEYEGYSALLALV
jgi:hypothetical protein